MDRIIRTKHASVKGSKDGYDDDYDSAYAFVFWSALIGISFLLSACGGGSSSGGSPVSVTAPAIVTPPTRLSLSYGPTYEAEYNNQRGLEAIEAATAYEAGHAGFGARLAVVDTGVDGHLMKFVICCKKGRLAICLTASVPRLHSQLCVC